MTATDPGVEYLNMQEAAEALGVTRRRILTMVKDGELRSTVNPLDRREMLIPREDVVRLARVAGGGSRPTGPKPRTLASLADPELQSTHLEEYILATVRTE